MEPLDLKSLTCFVRVVELRSFSKAALALRIAQPAISRHIQKLEMQLNLKLLVRSVRGVDVTDGGQVLYERAIAILQEVADLPSEVRAREDEPRGVVLMGVSPGAGKIIVPPMIERMRQLYPKLNVRIVEGFTGIIQQGLQELKFDLGLLYFTEKRPSVEFELLLHEPLFVIGQGKKEKEAARRAVYGLKDLVNLPLILPARPNQSRVQMEDLMASENLALNVSMEVDSIPIQKSLVQRGHGMAILSYGAVHEEVERGVLSASPIRSVDAFRKLIIARNTERRSTVAIRTVTKLVREIAYDLVTRGEWPGATMGLPGEST